MLIINSHSPQRDIEPRQASIVQFLRGSTAGDIKFYNNVASIPQHPEVTMPMSRFPVVADTSKSVSSGALRPVWVFGTLYHQHAQNPDHLANKKIK
jgi:hypothetical protein